MASSVTAAPCLVVSSHRILRNCGWGFIGSRQPRRAADLTGRFRVIVPTGAAGLRRSLQVGDQDFMTTPFRLAPPHWRWLRAVSSRLDGGSR